MPVPPASLPDRSTPDPGAERRPSLSYGHHRNTSIVHGIQHSRNTSFANPQSPSPLSPQIIAAAGGGNVHTLDGSMMISHDEFSDSPGGINPSSARYGPAVTAGAEPRHIPDGNTQIFRGPERRLERTDSLRVKRDHDHGRSQSRNHQGRNVGEMALHHLFNSFVGQADQKINQCVSDVQGAEPKVESVCGPGVDPAFDQLIYALGHVAREKPKPLIDTLMFWRKAKSEKANDKKKELEATRAALQPIHEMGSSSRPSLPHNQYGPVHAPTHATLALQQAVVEAERKSTVSIYLLCRVLMEIIGQSSLSYVTEEMAERLEDIIYSQLKQADPDSLEESPLKNANWVIFGRLLGVMSDMNFDSVASRFVSDLKEMQKHLVIKGLQPRAVEGKAVLIIRGMKYLRLKFQPEEAWSHSCDLMLSLGELFAGVHGQPVKHAYCHLFEEFLLPIAATATSEVNVPKWKLVIDTIKPRLTQMLSKPKHWQAAFPLMAILTCASPTEVFASQWMSLISPLGPKLKERTTRPYALRNVCRLVWTYLYRIAEPHGITIRKLEDVIRLVFQPGRRSYLSTEATIAEPIIQLIRFIGFKYQDLCFRNIIFPLMNSDQFGLGKELKVENLEPERMVIGIRAFLAVMADLEKGEQPPFPERFPDDDLLQPMEMPMQPISPRPSMQMRSPKAVTLKEERLSRPVMIADFPEITKESYNKFCKILGEITIICDNAFGGQAVLDEKFSSQAPKTPMAEAFSFGRRDDHLGASDVRQGFYDLLHVAVQALPRCLSPHINFNHLINLLCTGTAHVQSGIAASSAQSLKSIARQSHAQQVTIGFARFIFNFEDRYATMSDGGMLGPGHIESTLRLYVELLQIWIDEIKHRIQRASTEPFDGDPDRGASLSLSGVDAYVDEIESHGLFFLCSPSRRVRTFAVTVLRLVTEFDTALGKESSRVIRILEGSPQLVMDVNDEKLSVAERSRLQRGLRRSNLNSTLVELCGSDAPYDSTLWFKMFPNLVGISSEICPFAVAHTRNSVCGRLLQMQSIIQSLAHMPRPAPNPPLDMAANRGRLHTTPELTIEQWKLYLIFACTTLTTARGQQTPHQTPIHSRKGSKSSQKNSQNNRVYSAELLFDNVAPLLQAPNPAVRGAAVGGLGSINQNIYRQLLESLQPLVKKCDEDAKMRLATQMQMHQRSVSVPPRRDRSVDYLRTEVTYVYKLTSHFLRSPEVYGDDWILNNLISYTKDLRLFLNDQEVQNEWSYSKLRSHYCGVMEELFEGINRTKDPIRWMPFQARKAAFTLMEDWCGYSPNQNQIQLRENTMRRSVLEREHDPGNKQFATASMEIERKELRTAALSAMASLCGGPIRIQTESGVNLQFDVRRLLVWIDSIFETPSDKVHSIGRRALRNLILHNKEHPYLIERSVEMCYLSRHSKSLESYFEVVTQVLTEREDFVLPFYKVLSAGLYALGNESNKIRMKSLRILRILEERQQKNSKLQDLDISISDKTIAVYKAAQFEMSRRLAKQHAEIAFYVFSEFAFYFRQLQPDQQRNMVAAMLPWIQIIELQVEPNGNPTASSYMLLVNLFEITVKSGNILHNEIQALWQALATGPHAGNVQLVLDFIISLCSDKREQNFVDYAKQIVVYLSNTPAGSKVVEFLLLKITPRAMAPEKREHIQAPAECVMFPYVADLGTVLASGNKQSGFSLGQLCLILLVDLMVSPIQLTKENVPLLLQAVLVLWDHYTPIVQDQAREMLVHLMHELVISKIDVVGTSPDKKYIEDFIESIRQHHPKVVWSYEDANGKDDDESTLRVPEAMQYVATEVVKIFTITYPGIREEWGRTTLNWATNCPVRHLACRSFQLFRCILSSLDQTMLGDMLARLSNTISDEDDEIITFSMEILTTLRTIIEELDRTDLIQYPQLFWTTCACLQTVHEEEFMESLAMLDKLLDKLDLGDPAVLKLLKDHYPDHWEGGSFDGLAELVYKGVKSSTCLDRTLRILEKLSALPPSELVGPDNVLLFTLLANLPRYLQTYEQEARDSTAFASAENLANIAECKGHSDVATALRGFAATRYRAARDFLNQLVPALRLSFFPEHDFKSLVFLMGLLLNKNPWVKIKTMDLLCVIIQDIDLRKPDVSTKGSDLISPLLRLLQTEFCLQALQVLDHILNTPLSGTANPLERHHIRMSMAGSHSTRAFRKEYERTQSLYGIPEETGWSIPMPAVCSAMTRHNVHAVFYTTAPAEVSVAAEVTTPKIEFRAEEYPSLYSSFPPDERTITMSSEGTRGDGNIGDLMQTLDDLDDFFEDDTVVDYGSSTAIPSSPSLSRFHSGSSLQVRENLYDQQTAPILHKSLTRNASVSSFQTGFADMKITPTRSVDHSIMTPTAFSSPIVQASSTSTPNLPLPSARQQMHSRSVTSPSVNPQQQGVSRASPAGGYGHALTSSTSSLSGPGPGPAIDEDEEFLSEEDLGPPRAPFIPPGPPIIGRSSIDTVNSRPSPAGSSISTASTASATGPSGPASAPTGPLHIGRGGDGPSNASSLVSIPPIITSSLGGSASASGGANPVVIPGPNINLHSSKDAPPPPGSSSSSSNSNTNNSNSNSNFSLENMMRPFAQSRSVGAGLRSGMRRLTGGEKDRGERVGIGDPSSPIISNNHALNNPFHTPTLNATNAPGSSSSGGIGSRKKEGDALRQPHPFLQQRSITSPQIPQLPRLPPLPGAVTGTGALGVGGAGGLERDRERERERPRSGDM
ncbi:cell morphogenesis N-terminal-domain-containing protein [Phyllosticta citribraziliensis]|uniref:Cell morphogenesis N-terminal-domain-containing protein n=1 Tax=Phyllosticta citribraziliensis TaxID=989973 RepID=A0ABR1LUC3_9PEZI